MSEPLTDAEVAELRRHIGSGEGCIDGKWCAHEDAITRLLAELDLLRRRDREQAAGEEVLRQQLRDAERKIEMLRGGRG